MFCFNCGYPTEITEESVDENGAMSHRHIVFVCDHCNLIIYRNVACIDGVIVKDILELDWSETDS
jgi:hypothetical protein